MVLFPPSLAGDIAARHGVVTADALVTAGWSPRTLRRVAAAGHLVRCHPGVYRLATSADTFEARCAAVCAADPDVLITGTAAGRLWDLRPIGPLPVDRPPRHRRVAQVPRGRHRPVA